MCFLSPPLQADAVEALVLAGSTSACRGCVWVSTVCAPGPLGFGFFVSTEKLEKKRRGSPAVVFITVWGCCCPVGTRKCLYGAQGFPGTSVACSGPTVVVRGSCSDRRLVGARRPQASTLGEPAARAGCSARPGRGKCSARGAGCGFWVSVAAPGPAVAVGSVPRPTNLPAWSIFMLNVKVSYIL